MVSGRLVAGPYVRAACRRHLTDLVEAPARGYRFDLALVERVIGFFRDVLRLNVGEASAAELRPFVLQPSQAFIAGSLFGWVSTETGMRRFRTAYIEQGKGNGKSPFAAGLGLYGTVADDEPGAECYAAAANLDQALIMFRDAVAMRDQSPVLKAALVKHGGAKCTNLSYAKRGSFFRAVTASDGKSGPRPHFSLVDELHEHPNADVVDMLSAGQKGRRQPLLVEITNSGYDKQSVCYAHHEYSIRVAEGLEHDDTWFAYVCALDKADDPLVDESCWCKANPLLGVTIQLEYLRKQVREAIGMPSKQSTVRRLNFCQWVDAKNPWIDGPTWLAVEHEWDALEELAQCDDVVGALDLSGTLDLTALALAGRHAETPEEFIVRAEFWTPADTLRERARKDKAPYELWRDGGHLNATPGRSVDYSVVAERILDLQQLLPNLKALAFDPYRIKYLERELEVLGVEIELRPHPQGYFKPQPKKDDQGNELPVLWMPRSIEVLSKKVVDKKIRVERNPCLTWNAASAVLEADGKNNAIFQKRKSYGRIDGLVATAMAVGFLDLGGTIAPTEPNIRWL